MRVLVTGGTGYLGQTIVRALEARGHEPVVFARSAVASGLPGRLVDGDVRDAAALDRAADGCDAICHSAALVSLWRRRRVDFDEVNVGGLVNVLEVARARRVARIVYTSSFLARPPADASSPLAYNDYQRTKVQADAIAAKAAAVGAPIVRVYPGVVYGPGPATEGNLIGVTAEHLAGRLPGLIGADRLVMRVRGRCRGGTRGGARASRNRRAMRRQRERPQMRIGSCGAGPAAAADPVALAEMVGALRKRAVIGRTPPRSRAARWRLRHDWSLDSSRALELGYRSRLATGLSRTRGGYRACGSVANRIRLDRHGTGWQSGALAVRAGAQAATGVHALVGGTARFMRLATG
jgi:nucleoside-diphosphate-sugar epimerase